MSDIDSPIPQLINHFLDAHISEELPNFNWNDAVFLHFLENASSIEYQAYHFKEPLEKISQPKDFLSSPYAAALLGKTQLLVPLAQLPPEEIIPSWKNNGVAYIQILPVVLLSGPIGAILVSKPKEEEDINKWYHEYLPLMGDMVQECCLEDLKSRLHSTSLQSYEKEEDFLKAYTKLILEWIWPVSYRLIQDDKKELEARKNPLHQNTREVDTYSISLNTDEHSYTLSCELPSFQYPVKNQPDWLHEVNHYQVRKHISRLMFSTVFRMFYENWKITKKHKQSPYWLLQQIEDQIKELKAVMRAEPQPHVADPQTPPFKKPELNLFCFYKINEVWTIRFNGETISINVTAKKGMEAIRILLENRGEHFPTYKLHDILEQADLNYNVGGDQPTAPPQTGISEQEADDLGLSTEDPQKNRDQILIDDLLDRHKKLKKIEASIESKGTEEQIEYWIVRFENVKALYWYFRNDPQYKADYRRCLQKINQLSVLVDSNFLSSISGIHKESKPNRDLSNNKEKIRKAIKLAIKHMAEFEAIHNYLSDTIVFINRGSLKPFTYVHSLYKGDDLPDEIIWQTEP